MRTRVNGQPQCSFVTMGEELMFDILRFWEVDPDVVVPVEDKNIINDGSDGSDDDGYRSGNNV